MYKVLLIDDEPWILKDMELLVDWASLGFKIVAKISDPEQAIYLIKEQRPDLVICDIKMPGLNGIELIKMVKKRFNDLFVVFLSAYSEFSYAKQAIALGAFDYILKPIEKSELTDLLLRIRSKLKKDEEQKNKLLRYRSSELFLELIEGRPDSGMIKSKLRQIGYELPYENYLIAVVDFIDDNNYLHVFFEEDLFLNSQKKNVVWRVQNIDGNWEERIQANLDTQLVNAYGMDISEDKVNIAIIWDGSKDKEENVFVIEADMSKISLPPPSVDSLDIKKQNSLAEISWDSYPYDDFDHFNVYRSYSDKSKITELTPVASLSDKNATVYRDVLNTSSTLYYTVSVVDTDGNESEVSRWVSAEGEKQKNIVRDGFMEDPLYKWREWGKPAQAKKMFNKAYSGQTSFYINATEGHAGMQQANIPVEAGKKYRYSFRYKIEAGELQTVLAVGNPNGDFENKRKNLRNIDTEWSLYEREFYIPKDFDDNFIVRISSLFGSAHIDDIRIEEIVDFTRVKNGDFEKMGLGDFRGWGPNTDWKQVTTTVKSGYNALEIGGETGAGGIVQTGLLLEPGKKYKLEFDYKVDSGDFYYVLADNNANSDFERKYFTSTSTDGWVKEERYFRVRDSFTGSFNLRMSTGGGKTFVDNISIFELPGDDLNFDGNFEHEDLRFWRVWGSKNPIDFSKITTSTPVASSTHVMKIDGTLHGGTGMVQDLLQIELDKEYKVSFYAKVDSGDFRIALGNDDANVDTNGTWRIFKTRGKWKYVERVYTGEDFSSGYGTLRFSNRGGIAYVDDVRIEEIIE